MPPDSLLSHLPSPVPSHRLLSHLSSQLSTGHLRSFLPPLLPSHRLQPFLPSQLSSRRLQSFLPPLMPTHRLLPFLPPHCRQTGHDVLRRRSSFNLEPNPNLPIKSAVGRPALFVLPKQVKIDAKLRCSPIFRLAATENESLHFFYIPVGEIFPLAVKYRTFFIQYKPYNESVALMLRHPVSPLAGIGSGFVFS